MPVDLYVWVSTEWIKDLWVIQIERWSKSWVYIMIEDESRCRKKDEDEQIQRDTGEKCLPVV